MGGRALKMDCKAHAYTAKRNVKCKYVSTHPFFLRYNLDAYNSHHTHFTCNFFYWYNFDAHNPHSHHTCTHAKKEIGDSLAASARETCSTTEYVRARVYDARV